MRRFIDRETPDAKVYGIYHILAGLHTQDTKNSDHSVMEEIRFGRNAIEGLVS